MRELDDNDDLLDDDDEDTMLDRYLTFRIGEEDYGIPIRQVTEIVGLPHITAVPDMPTFIRGVINLRGTVIPVVDVRLRFGMPERSFDERTCVIVAQLETLLVGMIVDTVNEVLHIPNEHVAAPPQVRGGGPGRFVSGLGKVGDSVKILLEVQRLLRDEDIAALNQSAVSSP